jgi:outer membrane protein OmpA-like peptidoglycan-associated protein
MPMGEVSFADSVFLYDPGAPGIGTGDEPDTLYRISGNALGVPDDSLRNGHSTALGTGGTLILKFTDNRFYDGPGPDLYFWMPDEAIEDAIVWISEDGQIYRRAGIVSSGHPYLDISGTAETGVFYPLIKIRDDPDQEAADPYTLGATIDAVAGIHTVVVFSIESRLLFEGSQARLMEGADTFLSSAADRIRRFPRCHLLIEAYTGSSISGDLNLIVSQQWAKAVRDFLIEKEHLASTRFSALGLGSSWQFSGNSAAAGASEGFIQIIIFP